ncbi:hypothetical protein O3M35_006296 [Rhynocoris fuscipes]|uniref:MRG domain-containing protein n=1 Tax=Rhynocoris fuscipes TaxID=488301 RepID=A0AAW1DFJ7_9HEMI
MENKSSGKRKRYKRKHYRTDIDCVKDSKQIKIQIPDKLKLILINDCKLVIINNKLLRIPNAITAEMIIDEYARNRYLNNDIHAEKLEMITTYDFTNSIKYYFNLLLKSQLLYKSEFDQFTNLLKDTDIEPVSVYGAVHLLRLFVRIGSPLAYLRIDDLYLNYIKLYVKDFLEFLEENLERKRVDSKLHLVASDNTVLYCVLQ